MISLRASAVDSDLSPSPCRFLTIAKPAGIQVGDFLDWAEHESGQPWQTVAAGMWQAPHSVLRAPGESLRVSWRSYGDDTLRVALRALALRGPRVALPLRQVTAA